MGHVPSGCSRAQSTICRQACSIPFSPRAVKRCCSYQATMAGASSSSGANHTHGSTPSGTQANTSASHCAPGSAVIPSEQGRTVM